jgi:hypothetical protein
VEVVDRFSHRVLPWQLSNPQEIFCCIKALYEDVLRIGPRGRTSLVITWISIPKFQPENAYADQIYFNRLPEAMAA